jgi:hypothetical protein
MEVLIFEQNKFKLNLLRRFILCGQHSRFMQFTSPTFKQNAQQIMLGSNKNVLLVKDDVGKAKPSTFSLPQAENGFGKPLEKNAESAG